MSTFVYLWLHTMLVSTKLVALGCGGRLGVLGRQGLGGSIGLFCRSSDSTILIRHPWGIRPALRRTLWAGAPPLTTAAAAAHKAATGQDMYE